MTEEPIIYGMLIGFGGAAALGELERGQGIGAWATIALLMLLAGTIGMVRTWVYRSELPRARIHRR